MVVLEHWYHMMPSKLFCHMEELKEHFVGLCLSLYVQLYIMGIL